MAAHTHCSTLAGHDGELVTYAALLQVDAEHVSNFRRTILDLRIERVEGCGWGGDRQLYELYIRGTAFLWHQVGGAYVMG